MLSLLPSRLLRTVADSPLVISRERYCQILDTIVAANWLREFRRGRADAPTRYVAC